MFVVEGSIFFFELVNPHETKYYPIRSTLPLSLIFVSTVVGFITRKTKRTSVNIVVLKFLIVIESWLNDLERFSRNLQLVFSCLQPCLSMIARMNFLNPYFTFN